MPCADAETVVSYNKVTISNQSNQHQDKDACSPLCICSCCGCQGFAYNTIYNYNFISVKNTIDKKTPEYKSLLTSNFFGRIWQPPQINA
ncbi:hypothetical protein E0F76_07345 [Flavobacterium cellulosilyticum]|uniref:Uncharacterized protein n=2 Tax=Flavobacterium cellulosilyticum TaxID=2541731 RepID=A0A4V6PFA9_9FLAO|nr:hypothetical protein [Flavobacterium cellulosilyticum]TDD97907.1 hypothetical protein E0F76_07345 [Flavobacterium cellulosilyticum]